MDIKWAFTRSRYEPKKGAFVYPESEHERFKDLTVNQLEQLLGQKQENGVVYSDDGLLRFVPFGYQIGEMSPSQLGSNAYLIASANVEGAENLAKVAEKFRTNPHLWSFESINQPRTRVSALDSDLQRLDVSGRNRGVSRGGCSFGVSRRLAKPARRNKLY